MATGLHAFCSKEDILNDLQQKGLQITKAVNILKKEKIVNDKGEELIIKRGLPLFMLTFDNRESIENIYKIKTILNIVLRIEPLRKNSTMIPRCKRCQGFNHTQGYCKRVPRCVKYVGKYLTINCTINENILPKCVNCNGQHPASYHGCEVAKQLQKRRNEMIKPQQEQKNKVNK